MRKKIIYGLAGIHFLLAALCITAAGVMVYRSGLEVEAQSLLLAFMAWLAVQTALQLLRRSNDGRIGALMISGIGIIFAVPALIAAIVCAGLGQSFDLTLLTVSTTAAPPVVSMLICAAILLPGGATIFFMLQQPTRQLFTDQQTLKEEWPAFQRWIIRAIAFFCFFQIAGVVWNVVAAFITGERSDFLSLPLQILIDGGICLWVGMDLLRLRERIRIIITVLSALGAAQMLLTIVQAFVSNPAAQPIGQKLVISSFALSFALIYGLAFVFFRLKSTWLLFLVKELEIQSQSPQEQNA